MWCGAITRKRALLNGHHSPIGGTCSNFIIPIRWGLPTVIFFAWQAAATRLRRRHGGPLEILRFFWNVGRVYHSLQLAEEFHYATNPRLLPMKIFWNKIFLNGTFLRYFEMYLRSFGGIEKYYLTKSRIVCNYDLHTSSLMLLLRMSFFAF